MRSALPRQSPQQTPPRLPPVRALSGQWRKRANRHTRATARADGAKIERGKIRFSSVSRTPLQKRNDWQDKSFAKNGAVRIMNRRQYLDYVRASCLVAIARNRISD